VPDRQLGRWFADVIFILKQTQGGIFHQMLGISPGFGGDLRKMRFLLWREMYFRLFYETENRGWARLHKWPISIRNGIWETLLVKNTITSTARP
jgi:hypothetical protein